MKIYKRTIASVMALMMLAGTFAACSKGEGHHGDSNNLLGLNDREETTESEDVVEDTPTPTPEETTDTTEPEETEPGVVTYADDAYNEFCVRMQMAGYSNVLSGDNNASTPVENVPLISSACPNDEIYYVYHLQLLSDEYDCPAGLQQFMDAFNALVDADTDFAEMAYIDSVLRADTRVASIRFRSISADLYYGRYFIVNIDSQTGAILSIDDVVSDVDMMEYDSYLIFPAFYPVDITAEIDFTQLMWSMGYEGLNVYFDKADYGMGDGYGCITYNSAMYDQYISPYYLETPDEYEVEFNRYFDTWYDIGHDGVMDDIQCNYEYDNWEANLITVNGQSNERFDDDSNFVTYGSYIRRGNNDYVFTYTDNASDDGPCRIYNLADLSLLFDEEVSGGTDFITPSILRINRDISMIGNPMGYTDCTFSSDGTIDYSDPYYHFDYSFFTVNTVIDIDCQLVDEDGNYIEDFVLPAGSEVALYRHNGWDFEDVLYGDQIVRIFFEVEEDEDGWVTRTIDGNSIFGNAVFENALWGD